MVNFYKPVFSTQGRVFGLDIIRCLAILLVLVDHSLIFFPAFSGKELIREYAGAIGVELFFVLSGFLIGSILLKVFLAHPQFTWKLRFTFWNRRWLRTLPAFIVYLVIYVIVSLITGYEEFGHVDWKSVLSVLLFVQNFVFVQSNYYGISWSLAIEEWFYLLLPVALAFFFAIMKKPKMNVFLSTVISMIVIAFAVRLAIYFLVSSGILTGMAERAGIMSFQERLYTGIRKIVVLRLDAASYGVLMAFFYYSRKQWLERRKGLLFFTGLIMTFAALLSFYHIHEKDFNFISFVFTFPFFGIAFALMIPFIASVPSARFKPQVVNAIQYISIISYSIYLSHTIFQNLFLHWQGRREVNTAILFTVLMLLLTYFTSVTSYNYIERKGMMLRKADV